MCVSVSSLLVAYVSVCACLVLQTSNSLCFSLYLLSRHPDVQERLAAEVRATVADRNATYDDCERMPYMRAVLKESLRMFPVVTMNVRVLEDDLDVNGYQIPKGVSQLRCLRSVLRCECVNGEIVSTWSVVGQRKVDTKVHCGGGLV